MATKHDLGVGTGGEVGRRKAQGSRKEDDWSLIHERPETKWVRWPWSATPLRGETGKEERQRSGKGEVNTQVNQLGHQGRGRDLKGPCQPPGCASRITTSPGSLCAETGRMEGNTTVSSSWTTAASTAAWLPATGMAGLCGDPCLMPCPCPQQAVLLEASE